MIGFEVFSLFLSLAGISLGLALLARGLLASHKIQVKCVNA